MRALTELKDGIDNMPLERVAQTVHDLRLDGLVTGPRTPFTRIHFNTCFAEIEALLQRAGYHEQLDVMGYQGSAYAMFDPARWDPVQVLRWLREYVEEQARADSVRPGIAEGMSIE